MSLICPECRGEIPRSAGFCPKCGQRVLRGANGAAVAAVAVFGALAVMFFVLALA